MSDVGHEKQCFLRIVVDPDNLRHFVVRDAVDAIAKRGMTPILLRWILSWPRRHVVRRRNDSGVRLWLPRRFVLGLAHNSAEEGSYDERVDAAEGHIHSLRPAVGKE